MTWLSKHATVPHPFRHGRTCSGHPRLWFASVLRITRRYPTQTWHDETRAIMGNNAVTNRDKRFVKADFKKLASADCHNFTDENLNKVPAEQGVYVIYSPHKKKVVHVGRTYRGKAGLRQRLKNHIHGSSSFTLVYLKRRGKKLKRGYKFQYLPLPNRSWRRCALLEAYATGNLCPAHIGKHRRKRA
jgi:hypothetical protein